MTIFATMMIQVASDLHLEFFTEKTERKKSWSDLIVPSAPVLVLAGDICQATTPPKRARLVRFLSWCSENFEKVLYVPGNHEFYNIHNAKYKHQMCSVEETLEALSNVCERFHNVILLHRKTVIIDNVCFIGATLWTALPTEEARKTAKEIMNDFECIYQSPTERLATAEYASMHLSDRVWIERQLQDPGFENMTKVVITHHAPSYLGTCDYKHEAVPDFENNVNLEACTYGSALGDLVAQSDAWIFGHTHCYVNEIRSGCHLIANQRGYKDEPRSDFYCACVIFV